MKEPKLYKIKTDIECYKLKDLSKIKGFSKWISNHTIMIVPKHIGKKNKKELYVFRNDYDVFKAGVYPVD